MLELLDHTLLRDEIDALLRVEGALVAFTPSGRSQKTVCPRCKVAPKMVNPNGRLRPYCAACTHTYDIEYRNIKKPRKTKKPTDMCYRCEVKPRILRKSGEPRPYCRECFNLFNREYKARKAQNGQPT